MSEISFPPATKWLWVTVLVVALIYVLGMNNLYMPNNGDEMVYLHIARLTGESGHWLPLLSDYNNLRNTKPPLLFWQSMVVSGWGQYWNLWVLRLPSLIYLALISTGMSLLIHRWLGEWRTAAWAVLCFLLCWGSFRYGRPYMTTAPEMFWYSLAPGYVLWRAADEKEHFIHNSIKEWRDWTILGVLVGIGLAYKSFALIAPVAAGTWCLRMLFQKTWSLKVVACSMAQTIWMSLLALGMFACWLLIDPQPQEVWREFVVQENAGKMGDGRNYFSVLFSKDGSADYLAAPLLNTGLMFPWVISLLFFAWHNRKRQFGSKTSVLTKAILVWIFVWWLIFLIPNHRSSRYLLPLMPAIAMLMALHIQTIGRFAHFMTGLLAMVMVSVLVWLGWHAESIGLLPQSLAAVILFVWIAVGVLVFRIVLAKSNQAYESLVCVVLALLSLTALLHGMSGDRVAFKGENTSRPHHEKIWIPDGANGEFEPLIFLLPPNNQLVADQKRIESLTNGSDESPGTWFVVVRLENDQKLPCEIKKVCERVAVRWDIELRLKSGQVDLSNLARPREWLWRQEWLMRTL